MTELLEAQPPTVDESSDRYYQAVGGVEGTIIAGEALKIQIGDAASSPSVRLFPVSCPLWLRDKLTPGQTQVFRVYPKINREGLYFQLINAPQQAEAELSFTLKGCWESPPWGDRLVIYRNPDPRPSKSYKPVYLPLVWENAPPTDGQFWELQAVLKDDQLVVTAADGPYPPPPRYNNPSEAEGKKDRNRTRKPKTEGSSTPTLPPAFVLPSPLSIEEIRAMAVSAKTELTCKFSEVPPHRLVSPGVVEFFLADGDRILTVRIKQKQFQKLTDHGYASWIAAISGQLGAATESGFEMINPSLQVFERKPKEPASSPAEPPAEAPTVAIAEANPKTLTNTPAPSPVPEKPQAVKGKATGGKTEGNAATTRPPAKGPLRNVQIR